jgi:hypothetical protein
MLELKREDATELRIEHLHLLIFLGERCEN